MNKVILATVSGLISYAIASMLFAAPLFFIKDSEILRNIGHISTVFLLFAFYSSIVLARLIAPPRIEPIMQKVQFIYSIVAVVAFIVDNLAVHRIGVIDQSGDWIIPANSSVVIVHVALNTGPIILGAFILYNTLKSKSSIASKISFFTLGSALSGLAILSIVQLVTNRSYDSENFSLTRLSLTSAFFMVALSSVLLLRGSSSKQ